MSDERESPLPMEERCVIAETLTGSGFNPTGQTEHCQVQFLISVPLGCVGVWLKVFFKCLGGFPNTTVSSGEHQPAGWLL